MSYVDDTSCSYCFRSLTPVGLWYSSVLFISIRFIMGLMQCVLGVYLPLWVHEYAPASQRAKWMGALQSSVPFGVMIGYIIAAILQGPISSSNVCFHLLCWRWPLLFEWALLLPFCIAIYFVPSRHFEIQANKRNSVTGSSDQTTRYDTFSLLPMTPTNTVTGESVFKQIGPSTKARSFATVESKINGEQDWPVHEAHEVCEFNLFIWDVVTWAFFAGT